MGSNQKSPDDDRNNLVNVFEGRPATGKNNNKYYQKNPMATSQYAEDRENNHGDKGEGNNDLDIGRNRINELVVGAKNLVDNFINGIHFLPTTTTKS